MNYTMTVAINQYVARGTKLGKYDISLIEKGQDYSPDDIDSEIFLLFRYMIDNGKGTLSYYMELSFYNYVDDLETDLSNKISVMKMVLITDPIVVIILLFMLIPFILKVQSSLQRIYLHLCLFHEADIKKWLDVCSACAADIRSSITRMQRLYNEVTFDINPADYDKRFRIEQREFAKPVPKLNSTNEKFTEGPPQIQPIKNPEDEDEAMISQTQEEVVSERKQRTFSKMSQEKTKTYLAYLAFFMVYIAAFKVADGVLLADFYSSTNMKIEVMKLFNRRGWDEDNAVFFFRQNILNNKLTSYFERINFLLTRR